METHGMLAPIDVEDVRRIHSTLRPAARTVVSEAAKAKALDREAYHEWTADSILRTATHALFASLIEVYDGTDDDFERWVEEAADSMTVQTFGTESVDRVVWHRFDDRAVAATYHHEAEAARETLRRIAFNELYRDVIESVEDLSDRR